MRVKKAKSYMKTNATLNSGAGQVSATPHSGFPPASGEKGWRRTPVRRYAHSGFPPASGEKEEDAKKLVVRTLKREELAGMGHSVLQLPEVEPWPEPVGGAVLLDELERLLGRFVVLPKWGAETLALWILHTYAFPLRDVSTYLGLESPEKRCGKTTLLTVLSELVNRPVVAANISSPALFRVIEETRPTLLIDEADTLLQGNDELRGILNSGYTRKTAYVVRVANQLTHYNLRGPGSAGASRYPLQRQSSRPKETGEPGGGLPCEPQDGDGHRPPLQVAREPEDASPCEGATRLVRYSCWCPKIMAAIGRLPDTLADRCIVVRMQRKTADEQCERLRNLEAASLRQQCARFVRDHAEGIAGARPEVPCSLNDRAGDIWEPLLALADLAGGVWPEKARQAAVGLTVSTQENSPIGALFLDILLFLLRENAARIHSRTLVTGLTTILERPWAELRNGKPITESWLARQLRPYGIRPKTIWIGGIVAKGYLKEDFAEAFRRYIPRSELEALRAPAPEAGVQPGSATVENSKQEATP
jgi:hypothetical protein